MVSRLILFTSSLTIVLGSLAQEQGDDSVRNVHCIIPSIYVDYGKLLTVLSKVETKYEGGVEILFREKFPLVIEIGVATLSPDHAWSNGSYESSGLYYRIGTGIYSQFNSKNKLGFTVRYGSCSFDETRRIVLESSSGIQELFVASEARNNLSASWLEAVIYSDRKLNDLLAIGMNLRFRLLQNYDQQSPVDVYVIPGYGRSFDKSIPAVNLFLKISF